MVEFSTQQLAYVACIFVVCCNAYAFTLMKQTHLSEEKDFEAEVSKSSLGVLRKLRFLVGLLMLFGAAAGQFALFPYISGVLIGTLFAWQLGFGQLLAICCLGEQFSIKYDLPALFLCVSGCLVIALTSNYTEVVYSKELITHYVTQPVSICTVALYFIAMVCSCMLDGWLKPLLRKAAIELYDSTGVFASTTSVSTVLSHASMQQDQFNQSGRIMCDREVIAYIQSHTAEELRRKSETAARLKITTRMRMVWHCFDSGVSCVIQIVFAKFSSALLTVNEGFNNPVLFWTLSVLAISGAIYQVISLNRVLKDYNQLDVIPVFKSFIMTMPMLAGLYIMDEIDNYTNSQIMWLVFGTSLCLLGVLIIYLKAQTLQQDNQVQTSDENGKMVDKMMTDLETPSIETKLLSAINDEDQPPIKI